MGLFKGGGGLFSGSGGGGLFGMGDPIGGLMGYRGQMTGKTGLRFGEQTYGPAREMAAQQAPTLQYQLPTMSTGFGGYNVTPEGVSTYLSPEYQAAANQLMQASQGALGQAQQAYGALGSFDPYQAAEMQFQRLESILNPERQRQQEALQSQLYAQGRLGSTGGALSEQAYNQAVQQQQSQNLYNAFLQAQQTQQNLAGLGQGLFGTALQGIGGAGQIEQMPLSTLGYGMQYGGQQQAGRQAAANMMMAPALAQSAAAAQYGLADLGNLHDFGMTSYKMFGGSGMMGG